MPEPWLSADDIATHLGVTKDTVYAWIAEKGMPAEMAEALWRQIIGWGIQYQDERLRD